MKLIHYTYTLILCFFLVSCDFSYSKRIGESDYYIGWGIDKEYTTLYFGNEDNNGHEGIIEGRVTDVYWNEKYILAKKCELYNDNVEGYYIFKIVKYGKEKASQNMLGPLFEKEYEMKKKELRLNEKEMKHINLFD